MMFRYVEQEEIYHDIYGTVKQDRRLVLGDQGPGLRRLRRMAGGKVI